MSFFHHFFHHAKTQRFQLRCGEEFIAQRGRGQSIRPSVKASEEKLSLHARQSYRIIFIYLRPGIESLAEKRKESFDDTLRALREYYDGYLFTEEGSRLYNPFSILKALKDKRIDPYWFASGFGENLFPPLLFILS